MIWKLQNINENYLYYEFHQIRKIRKGSNENYVDVCKIKFSCFKNTNIYFLNQLIIIIINIILNKSHNLVATSGNINQTFKSICLSNSRSARHFLPIIHFKHRLHIFHWFSQNSNLQKQIYYFYCTCAYVYKCRILGTNELDFLLVELVFFYDYSLNLQILKDPLNLNVIEKWKNMLKFEFCQ